MRIHPSLILLLYVAVFGVIAVKSRATPGGHDFPTLQKVVGPVNVNRGGNNFVAVNGMPITQGDSISTGPDGRTTLTMTDQSQIQFQGNTTVNVTTYQKDVITNLQLGIGEINANIAQDRLQTNDRSFNTHGGPPLSEPEDSTSDPENIDPVLLMTLNGF